MHQPLAYIHSDANIARNVVIEPFVTIEKNVTIGEGTWIGSNVTIMEGARIGKNCRIFPGAVISAIPQDLKFEGEKSLIFRISSRRKRSGKVLVSGGQDFGFLQPGCYP